MKTANMGRPILSSDHQIKLSLSAQKQQSPLKLFHKQWKELYSVLYNTRFIVYLNFKFLTVFSLVSGLDSRGLLAHQRRSKRVFPEGEKTSRKQSTLAVLCLVWLRVSSTSFPGLFPQKLEKSPENEVRVRGHFKGRISDLIGIKFSPCYWPKELRALTSGLNLLHVNNWPICHT